MVSALLITLLLTQAPQATGAPSDEPAPTADTSKSTGDATDAAPVLKGLDLGFTVFNSSGTFFGSEGYSNSFTFWFEPAWRFGQTFFRGSWGEKLSVTARIPVEVELAGSDPRFRGTGFATSALFNPEALAIIDTQSGAVDGTWHRGAILGDSWVSLGHGRLFSVLGIEVASSLRVAIPTSLTSQHAGLITSTSLGLSLERKFFSEHLALGYAFRPTKYFYSRTHGGIGALGTTFELNGNPETPYTFSSNGVANPDFGFMNGFWATVTLPKGFSVGLNYFLFNTKPYPNNPCTQCSAGVGGREGVWRNEHWFLGSVDFEHSFWSVGLGLSTFRSLETTLGTTSQPFWESNRNNYTTLYLSFSATAEGVAAFVKGKPEGAK